MTEFWLQFAAILITILFVGYVFYHSTRGKKIRAKVVENFGNVCILIAATGACILGVALLLTASIHALLVMIIFLAIGGAFSRT